MHIGIIPDGNRRWAKLRRTNINQAYAIGFCRVIQISLELSTEKITHISFFGLSKDNYLKRPRDQLENILTRMTDSMWVSTSLLREAGIKTQFYGDIEGLREIHRKRLGEIEAATTLDEPRMHLSILVNYSSEMDIRMQGSCTSGIPICHCVFRSGGARRLSGFLPAQTANAELHFSKKLWPDVRPKDIKRVIYKLVTKNHGA